jgi:hypothetical protein
MKVKVFVFGAFLIVSHTSMAEQVVLSTKSVKVQKSQKRQQYNLNHDIVEHLIKRGLEADAAQAMVPVNNSISDTDMAQLLHIMQEVSYQELVEVLASRVMQKQSIDLYDIDTLISIAHICNGVNINSEMRQTLHDFSHVNAPHVA